MKNKELPQIGLGTWLLEAKNVDLALSTAKESGYNHIDTAQLYNNEYQIGQAVKKLNYDCYITTKIWPLNYKNYTRKSFFQSLERLEMSKIDLVLLHWPLTDELNAKAYKELMTLREEGYVNNVGVSNFSIIQLEKLREEAGEYPYSNQIMFSPITQEKELIEFCRKNNIVVTGYSSIRPYYNPRYEWQELKKEEKESIDLMADKYNKKPAQIILRWALEKGLTIIPKSMWSTRIKENIEILDFKLTEDEIQIINNMNRPEISEMWNKKVIIKADEWDKKLEQGLLFDKNYDESIL